MEKRVVLLTGASGYIASQLAEVFRDRFELRMADVRSQDRGGAEIAGVEIVNLVDPDRSKYAYLFEGVDAVVHLGYKGGPAPRRSTASKWSATTSAWRTTSTARHSTPVCGAS